MPTIPTPAEELANSKVNAVARKIWAEALTQPEFADVGVIWGYSASSASDHRNGRCCDFMVTYATRTLTAAERVTMGDRIRAYFVKHAARLHVQGIIWNHKVTGFPIGSGTTTPDVTYRGPAGTARTYSGADQHTDHVHVQVSGGLVTSWLTTAPAWDGATFPGVGAFTIGTNGPWVTLLGQRLVVHGWTGYSDGPGPEFTDTDRQAVAWFQAEQGWSGADADGYPGPLTWQLLMANPAVKPAPPVPAKPASEPEPDPEPTPVPAPEVPEVPATPKLTSIRVATFNVLSDAAGIKGGEGSFASRLDRIVATIKASKASILLLQECNADRAADLQDRLGADWIWSRANARVVMVDKTVWTMGEERVRTMPSPYSKTDKTWPLVELTHKAGGDVIWAASVHFSSTSPYAAIATSAQMTTERKQQAESIVADLKDYRWVVGGGDHNSSSLTAGKPKKVLFDAGFSLLTRDPDFDSAAVDSFPNKTAGGQQIDDIWCKGGLTITDGQIISSAGGSDHNLMVAELTIAKRTDG